MPQTPRNDHDVLFNLYVKAGGEHSERAREDFEESLLSQGSEPHAGDWVKELVFPSQGIVGHHAARLKEDAMVLFEEVHRPSIELTLVGLLPSDRLDAFAIRTEFDGHIICFSRGALMLSFATVRYLHGLVETARLAPRMSVEEEQKVQKWLLEECVAPCPVPAVQGQLMEVLKKQVILHRAILVSTLQISGFDGEAFGKTHGEAMAVLPIVPPEIVHRTADRMLTFIVAHEFSHLLLDHPRRATIQRQQYLATEVDVLQYRRELELEADGFAAHAVRTAIHRDGGYWIPTLLGTQIFFRIAELAEALFPTSISMHPPARNRWDRVKEMWRGLVPQDHIDQLDRCMDRLIADRRFYLPPAGSYKYVGMGPR